MFFRNIIDGNVILIIISSHYCLSYCPEWFLVEYEHVFDWSVRVLTALHLKATDVINNSKGFLKIPHIAF